MREREHDANRERGSILVLAMLVTLLILGLGLTVMWVASSDTRVTVNITRRQEGLFAAEACLNRARAFLNTEADWQPVLDPANNCSATKDSPGYSGTSTGAKGRVLCIPTLSGVALEDVQITTGTTGLSNVTGSGNLRYTLWVRNDAAEVEWNNAQSPARPVWNELDHRIIVRCEGSGRDALSYFAIEAVIAKAILPVADEGYPQKGGSGGQNTNAATASIAR
jgi:Tfp pilus assembly protein PilX